MIRHCPAWVQEVGLNPDSILERVDEIGLVQHYWRERMPFPRLTAWFSDAGVGYGYSGQVSGSNPFPDVIAPVFNAVKSLGYGFNSCLANYYRTGQDSVSWHKDDEKIFIRGSMIASVTFGQSRKFQLKTIAEPVQRLEFNLGNGDLLLFDQEHKEDWLHRIPKEPKIIGPRLNLTFRIVESQYVAKS